MRAPNKAITKEEKALMALCRMVNEGQYADTGSFMRVGIDRHRATYYSMTDSMGNDITPRVDDLEDYWAMVCRKPKAIVLFRTSTSKYCFLIKDMLKELKTAAKRKATIMYVRDIHKTDAQFIVQKVTNYTFDLNTDASHTD